MKTRILSGLLLLPLLLLLLLGGRILLIGCFIIGAVGVKEFYRGFENINKVKFIYK
jgi:phosphatidate cytidylyltransferase